MDEPTSYRVDSAALPSQFPTHRHAPEFWEELGRAVATYGFLEEVLGKAIFAFSGTTSYSDDAVAKELEKWKATLEKALTDALGGSIVAYQKAVEGHGGLTMENFDELIADPSPAATPCPHCTKISRAHSLCSGDRFSSSAAARFDECGGRDMDAA